MGTGRVVKEFWERKETDFCNHYRQVGNLRALKKDGRSAFIELGWRRRTERGHTPLSCMVCTEHQRHRAHARAHAPPRIGRVKAKQQVSEQARMGRRSGEWGREGNSASAELA
jgi:hypothetical protein